MTYNLSNQQIKQQSIYQFLVGTSKILLQMPRQNCINFPDTEQEKFRANNEQKDKLVRNSITKRKFVAGDTNKLKGQ